MKVECPICLGNKVQTISISEDKKEEKVQIACVTCRGKGLVSEELVAQLEEERAKWCECRRPKDAYYVKANQHKELKKHHWRCGACDKVVQIG